MSVKSIEKQAAVVDEKSIGDVSSLEYSANGSYRAAFPKIKESVLVRKIDMRVMPFIFILNFFTFLDR